MLPNNMLNCFVLLGEGTNVISSRLLQFKNILIIVAFWRQRSVKNDVRWMVPPSGFVAYDMDVLNCVFNNSYFVKIVWQFTDNTLGLLGACDMFILTETFWCLNNRNETFYVVYILGTFLPTCVAFHELNGLLSYIRIGLSLCGSLFHSLKSSLI